MMNVKTSRRLAVGASAALSIAALTAGCAGGASGAAAGGAGGNGSEFIVGINAAPPTLNSGTTSDGATLLAGAAMFNGLIATRSGGKVVPQLATSWTQSKDGLSYTFKLRKDVKFSDGKPMTAEDVKFSLDKVMPLSPLATSLVAVLDHVEVLSKYSVRLTLKHPFAPLLSSLDVQAAPILPKHVYGKGKVMDNPANKAPIGTGPYKFESWSDPSKIVLTKNENYWGHEPSIKRLIFKVIPDSATMIQSLRTGAVSFVPSFWVPFEQVKSLKKDSNIYVKSNRQVPAYDYLNFNTAHGPLAKAKVRKALFQAIDRKGVNASVFSGNATVVDGFVPPAFAWAKDPTAKFSAKLPYDPKAAAELLTEAGYPAKSGGTRFTLRYVLSPEENPMQSAMASVIKNDWKKIGVDVKLTSLDSASYENAIYAKGDYDVSVNELSTLGDPTLGIARVFTCNPKNAAYRNPTRYCSKDLDALWNQVAQKSGTARGDAMRKVQDRLIQEVPSIPLVEQPESEAISKKFAGFDKFFAGNKVAGGLQYEYLTASN